MAKDEQTGAADKGKGKVDDVRELNGEKKGTKDGKPLANGKKDEEPKEGRVYHVSPSQLRVCRRFWETDILCSSGYRRAFGGRSAAEERA
jgi:hypothetical protein